MRSWMDEVQTELQHYGIPGMKWGVRRYQNSDGSLTPKGQKRYLKHPSEYKRYQKKISGVSKKDAKKIAKIQNEDAEELNRLASVRAEYDVADAALRRMADDMFEPEIQKEWEEMGAPGKWRDHKNTWDGVAAFDRGIDRAEPKKQEKYWQLKKMLEPAGMDLDSSVYNLLSKHGLHAVHYSGTRNALESIIANMSSHRYHGGITPEQIENMTVSQFKAYLKSRSN